MRSMSWSAKPASSRRPAAELRTSPCAHGHALMPHASTPTTRRTRCGDAAAIPISFAISCVGRSVTGVRRSSGYCASMRTSARSAPCRSTMCAAMCCARVSTRNASPITTASIASPNDSGNRDMWTPFWAGSRSTVQEISAANVFSRPSWRMRIAFWTPVTPARVSPSWTSGVDACRSRVRSFRVPAIGYNRSAPMEDTRFPRIVSLACHDLRTPLATIYGFARTLTRMEQHDERTGRYLVMIEEASQQMTDLLDELGAAARIEAGRWEPALREVDTAELARGDDERIAVEGKGETIETDADAVRSALRSLAVAALRHGPVEQVTWSVDGRELSLAPVTAAAAPIVTGEEVRDLGALVAVSVVGALDGSVELAGDTLRVRL